MGLAYLREAFTKLNVKKRPLGVENCCPSLAKGDVQVMELGAEGYGPLRSLTQVAGVSFSKKQTPLERMVWGRREGNLFFRSAGNP